MTNGTPFEELSERPPDLRKARRAPASMDLSLIPKLPPHSLEGEQGVIGSILLSPREAMPFCEERMPAGADTFYGLNHQLLFSTLQAMHLEGVGIDLLTLHQRLKDNGQLEATGGLAYLSGLMDAVPSAANLEYYLGIVREKFVLRRIIQTCSNAIHRVHEHEGEVDPLLTEIERDIVQIVRTRDDETTRPLKDIKESHSKFVNWAEDRHRNQGRLCGITSGLHDLDAITDGFQAGELTVIGARPGIGKSAIALEIIRAASVEAEQPVPSLFLSLEMSEPSLYRRMVASIARVSLKRMRQGTLTQKDFAQIHAACVKISRSPVKTYDGLRGVSASKAAAIIRLAARDHGTKLVVVDYLQKLRSDLKHEKRTYEVADISETLLSVARETGVALICLAQVNRESEKEKDSVPRLGHLSDSSGIEKAADLVILLHRDRTNNTGPADLIVAKQRDGETGVAHTIFLGEFCRFESAAKVEARQQPLAVENDRWPD